MPRLPAVVPCRTGLRDSCQPTCRTGEALDRIFWDDDPMEGLVVEPATRMDETLRALGRMREADTVAELETGSLPPWAEELLVQHREDLDPDDPEPAPWQWSEMAEVVVDVVPLPWDARSLASWLPGHVTGKFVVAAGASVGGHSDEYVIDDRDGFFSALEQRGFELERLPGLVGEFQRAL